RSSSAIRVASRLWWPSRRASSVTSTVRVIVRESSFREVAARDCRSSTSVTAEARAGHLLAGLDHLPHGNPVLARRPAKPPVQEVALFGPRNNRVPRGATAAHLLADLRQVLRVLRPVSHGSPLGWSSLRPHS